MQSLGRGDWTSSSSVLAGGDLEGFEHSAKESSD